MPRCSQSGASSWKARVIPLLPSLPVDLQESIRVLHESLQLTESFLSAAASETKLRHARVLDSDPAPE